MTKCREYAMQVNPDLTILELSCRSGEGLDSWYSWLETALDNKQQLNETRS
jgi:hydrogenase nickel incorporation protein HypB